MASLEVMQQVSGRGEDPPALTLDEQVQAGLADEVGSQCSRPALLGLLNSASSAGSKAVQQDAHLHFHAPGCKVVALADGISATPEAQQAAQAAVVAGVTSLAQQAYLARTITLQTLRYAFNEAQWGVQYQNRLFGYLAPGPATTLIMAVELSDRFLIGYVGDGAAVLTTGCLQWLSNLLFPQVGAGGAIAHYLGMDRREISPSLIELPKHWPDGGIVLLGTDGALPQGEVLRTASLVLHEVRDHICRSTNRSLDAHAILEAWVGQRLTTDDNRSLGLLVSAETVDFWRRPSRPPAQDGEAPHADRARRL